MKNIIKMLALFLIVSLPDVCGRDLRPMTMVQLFELADSHNPDIGAADAKIAASRQGESVAKNAMLPQINASLTLSYLGDGTILDRNLSNATRDRLPHFSNTLGVEVYQPVYTGGAIRSGIRLADKETEMAVNSKEALANSIRMDIAANYLELAKQRNLLKVYDENIVLTEKLLTEMKARYAQGTALKNDITRYELRLSSISYDRLATCNAIKILNNNLVLLTGVDGSTDIVPDITNDGNFLSGSNDTPWLDVAQSNSPSLKSMNILTDMERLGRDIAWSEYIPKIGLVAGDNFLGPITFEVPALNKNYNAWFLGVNVKWNLSSLFTTPKSTRKYDLELHRIQIEKDAVLTGIERDITEAVTLYRQSIERMNIERKNVQLAEENYSVVANRFNNDLALLTDMLDASNARLDAGVRLVNAEISARYYYYRLHYITGTLIKL